MDVIGKCQTQNSFSVECLSNLPSVLFRLALHLQCSLRYRIVHEVVSGT